MKRSLLLILALVMLIGSMLMTAFAANEESSISAQNPFAGKTVSILSASTSTYAGVSNNTAANSTIGNNDVYYTEGRHGVYREDTWWQQAIDALGMELLVNNAWSGSCIFKPRKGEASVGYGDRAVNLHNDHTGEEPDIIWVYLGSNDFAYYQDTFGKADEVDYAALIEDNGDGTFTYGTPATTCEAYAIMLHKIQTRYPNAEVYCMPALARRNPDYAEDGRPDPGQPTEYNAELIKVAEHFACTVIDWENCIPKEAEQFDKYIGDKRAHPNALGMDLMSKKVISTMLGQEVALYHVSGTYTGVCTDNSAAAAIGGMPYHAKLTAVNGYSAPEVTVTMGGVDVTQAVYANGAIYIETVTGDIEITASAYRAPQEFRWEVVEDHLVSSGKDENTLTALSETITDGMIIEGQYKFAESVILKHDRPWVVEWKCAGDWRGILLSTHSSSSTDGRGYLARTKGGQLCFGVRTGSQSNNYGIDLSDLDGETHIYRLENRIDSDGSNMVWLYLDGVEIGPMNNYFIASKDQGTTSDWISGKNFVFPYIGMDSTPVTNCQLDYLSIQETGHTHTYENGTCTGCGAEDPNGLALEGLNVLCLGDSITAGQGLTTATRWTNVLATKYGWTLTNKSQGGISLSSYYYTSKGQADVSIAKKAEILKTMTTKPDVIIVWGGHNDTSYRASPLGTWEDNTTDSFKGALKYIAELSDEYAPDATLFVLTPLWVNEKPSALKLPENTTDTDWMFVDAIYDGAEKYGWIPINMDLCGITPFTKSGLLLDNIHPNEAGTEKIVEYLSEELANYGQNSKKQTIIFNQSSVSIEIGKTTTLKAVLSPRSGNGTPAFTWSSSNTAVATVDSNGVITAVAHGNAIVTATTNDGISATVSIAVGKDDHTYENGVCTGCGAEHPNMANYKGKVISILGGSTCTFDGYIPVADGFNLAHRPRYPQSNLLTDVNDTWWMQVIAELGAKLGINDSWAGSQVLNTLDSNSGDLGPDAAMASLTRILNLGANGTPDVILFYGAMNDIGRAVTLGSFDSDTAPVRVDLTATKWDNLADAYVAAIMRMQHYYPDAQIVAMLPGPTASYYTKAERQAYCEVLKAICDHYGVPTVDLSTCGLTTSDMPDGTHPNAEGMDYITNAVLETLLSECQMEAGKNVVHSVTHELIGAESSLGYYKGVSDGKPFVTTITGEDVIVTVTMGGVDITDQVYADGKVVISAVTGDVVITAKGVYNADGRLQPLPENYCCNTNLWTELDPVNEYYTASGWGNNSNSNYSVTFPVTAGDRIWATSFGAAGTNGYSSNAVRITWFSEDGVLESLGRDVVYAEFAKHGYITVPEGAVAVNIPMVSNANTWEIYILNRDHSYEFIVTAPTCTEQGYTTYTCSLCQNSYVDNYTEKIEHSWGNGAITKAPTCTTDGVRSFTCHCGATRTEVEKATGHSYKDVVTAPTCTERGYTTHTCHCGDSYVDAYVNALGHEWNNGVITVEPTVSSKGEMLYTCNTCGGQKTEDIPKLTYITGDIDGNEEITSNDAVYLLMNTLFPEDYPVSEEQKATSDFDGDGEVNSNDAVYLLMYTIFPEDYPLQNTQLVEAPMAVMPSKRSSVKKEDEII